MLKCEECEYFSRNAHGETMLHCDPSSTIKEPECLQKHQIARLDRLVRSYEAVLEMQRRLAPLQEKMMRILEREVGDIEEADRWKLGAVDDDEFVEDDPD